MKWLKLVLVLIAAIPIIYVAWYFWLSIQAPSWEYDESASTKHVVNKNTVQFIPDLKKIQKPCCLFKVSSEHEYIGGHYINLFRWLSPFDPNKPAGIITWKGKTVGYFWASSKPINNYHWHIHGNMCITSGADTTTDLNTWECIKRGYLPATPMLQRYMLHAWIIPNPNGVNDMWNPNLK